ncbi:MAG TPA: hypothetical protein VMZ53_14165, partial [Kofleriaceae bacterium]|nr:hypothetical protein [Kofleriaceae bacterium]
MRHLTSKRRFRFTALAGLAVVVALAGVAVATDSFALISNYSQVIKFVGLNGDGTADSPISINTATQ